MKIKLSFDSFDEFVDFILSSSSMYIHNPLQPRLDDKVYEKMGFINCVDEMAIDGIVYLLEPFVSLERRAACPESAAVDFQVFNYMLNDAQIENDSVYIRTKDAPELPSPFDRQRIQQRDQYVGLEEVRSFLLQNIPCDFLLRIGWATDYKDYVLRIDTSDS